MSELKSQPSSTSEDAVEVLLKRAAPRPVPPEEQIASAREAVRTEWRRSTKKHRRTVHLTRLAVAASVIAAVFLALNALQTTGVEPQTVAAIDRQFGLIRIVGDNATVVDDTALSQVTVGQVLSTGDAAGAALSLLTGGALRIDADTQIEFVSASEIRLHAGQVYFDSTPALGMNTVPRPVPLTIITEFGVVTHIGTRYMTKVDRNGVTVSVRDGIVRVTNEAGLQTDAASREQMQLSRGGAVTKANIRPYGSNWAWIESVSPVVALDGRSVVEFLDWVSHETGLVVEFESAAALNHARQERLNGQLDATPRQALEIWMLATNLDWRIDDERGVIHVNSR